MQGRKLPGIVLIVVGSLVAILELAFILHTRSAHPGSLKLLAFHPVLDLIALAAVAAILAGAFLWLRTSGGPEGALSQ